MLLLYADELVFTKPARRWLAALGDGATFGGRYLAFPALLSPGSPVFRAAWNAPADAGAPALEAVLRVVRPLRWHAWLLALALFVLVPAALALHASSACLLGLLALIYLPTMLAVLYLVRRRGPLGLSRKELASIAFDAIACPPFALNLVRRVTLRCGLPQAAPAFADAVLDAPARARLQQALETRWALLDRGREPEDAA
ncbi:hypothetical protein [Thermomonas sp.]|uniref:hypothetical protein n=1 Tax=Thermomonas sp. TaxID=1971895 RepID=UPI0039E5804C